MTYPIDDCGDPLQFSKLQLFHYFQSLTKDNFSS